MVIKFFTIIIHYPDLVNCTILPSPSNGKISCNSIGVLTCNDPEVEIANSQSVGDCSSVTYGSSCLLNCSSGYSVSGNGEHVCDDVNDEGTAVKWRSVGGFACVAG